VKSWNSQRSELKAQSANTKSQIITNIKFSISLRRVRIVLMRLVIALWKLRFICFLNFCFLLFLWVLSVKAISNIAPAWEIGFDAFGYSALKFEIYLIF